MKKTLIIIAAALIAASCTFESTEISQRTKENLATMAVEILGESSDFAVSLLSNIHVSTDLDVFAADLDTVATHSYYGFKIAVSAAGQDSTWFFSNVEGSALEFSGTIRMTGIDKSELPLFECTFSGSFDEGDGFSASFGAPDTIAYSWSREYSSYGSGYDYIINRNGQFVLYTFNEGDSLDELTLTLKGDGYSY